MNRRVRPCNRRETRNNLRPPPRRLIGNKINLELDINLKTLIYLLTFNYIGKDLIIYNTNPVQ